MKAPPGLFVFRLLTLCAWVGFALACRPTDPREALVPLPETDLSRVDPSLRERIETLRSEIQRELAEPTFESDTEDLGRRFGELGTLFHVCELLEAAEAAYGNAARLAPHEREWPYYVGMVHQTRGELDLAREALERTLALDEAPAALLRVATVRLEAGDVVAARDALDRVRAAPGADAAVQFGLGRLALVEGEPEVAVERFRRALELQPEASAVHYPLAQAYQALGEAEAAERHLSLRGDRAVRFPDPLAERLSEFRTRNVFSQIALLAADFDGLSDEDFLGFVREQAGEVAGAADELERRIAQGPPAEVAAGPAADRWRARMHYGAGGLQARAGSTAAAIRSFHTAVALHSGLRDATVRMGNALARSGRFEEAADAYTRLLETDPADVDALLRRATVWMNLKRLGEAATDLERVIALQPENGMARLRLATLQAGVGQLGEAERSAGLALGSDLPIAERAGAHGLRATLLTQRRRYAEALRELELGLALPVEEAGRDALTRLLVYLLAACPQEEIRDGQRAMEAAEALGRSSPSVEDLEVIAMAMAEVGRFEEASELQRRLIEAEANGSPRDRSRRLQAALALYEAGRPYRIP